MQKQIFTKNFHGKNITIEIGEIAKQANGACIIRYEDTVVLTTTTASKKASNLDFFPLMVLYQEKLYSVGKIPGGFIKREGRPSDHSSLMARLIDRPIRPLFKDGFRNEIQIVNTILSVDTDNSPEMMAMLGSSLSLMVSDVPFEGPIAGVVVGENNGKFIINPTPSQLESSSFELTVAGTKEAINMVEAGAKEASEEVLLEALKFGHLAIQELVEFQEEIIKSCEKEKMEITVFELNQDIYNEVHSKMYENIKNAIQIEEKMARSEALKQCLETLLLDYEDEDEDTIKHVKLSFDKIEKEEVRRLITIEKIRPDGRKLDEIRPLNSQIDFLPRTHGSGLFTRGQTQALSICTLGAVREHQIIDGLGVEDTKRFMLHYNFPAFSVGETGRYGAPGRREIGHGALGERALLQVLPSEEEFPYTIRIVSEILESNGSTSQASICAGTLALMAAGVPIKAPVAGIAMGLITNNEDYSILSDIQGMEDHLGDMDFKVAGTKNGVTALQMDIKIKGLTFDIFKEALEQARVGRLHILENMNECIETPRAELSKYAPKIMMMKIEVNKIKEVIGRGGETITNIITECGDVKIDIEDDGRVIIYHTDYDMIKKAMAIIEEIVKEVKLNEIYEGRVARIEKFGCFIELWKGTDGMCHISKLAVKRVEKVEDVVKIGDIVKVKVIKIDERGRIDLSIVDALEKVDKKIEENK